VGFHPRAARLKAVKGESKSTVEIGLTFHFLLYFLLLMLFGILVFPGTNCERDCAHVVTDVLGHQAQLIWHENTDVSACDALILPGGFAHGDYLRTGAIARFSPVMDAVAAHASLGKPVLGICNGFQILCEAGLLPGVLRRNREMHFLCRVQSYVRVEHNENQFLHTTTIGDVLQMPIRHGEGSYFADDATLDAMEANRQILVRYCDKDGNVDAASNLNGSSRNIAGVMNEQGNVFGLMPHPEAASEAILGSADGLKIFSAMTTRIFDYLSTTERVPVEARIF
jgi:phosphoribosylformylglycinamidine synthase